MKLTVDKVPVSRYNGVLYLACGYLRRGAKSREGIFAAGGWQEHWEHVFENGRLMKIK